MVKNKTEIYSITTRVRVPGYTYKTVLETDIDELCPHCYKEALASCVKVVQAGHFTEDEYTGICDHCEGTHQ